MLTGRDLVAALRATDGPGPARLGLRFDRVVVRVIGALRAFADGEVPADMTVLLALCAPIRQPARTVAELGREIHARIAASPPRDDWIGQVNGTGARLRIRSGAAPGDPRLLGLVHNPGSDAGKILDRAEQWLNDTRGPSPTPLP